MEDNRIIVAEVPVFRLSLDSDTQAHHAIIDCTYDLVDDEMLSRERAELEARLEAMAAKRRLFLGAEASSCTGEGIVSGRIAE